jgi:phosphohistidine phosphatase SixA
VSARVSACAAAWLGALLLAAGFACAGGAQAERAVYVVRHAEKASEAEDAPLSAAGHARAQRLAERLGGAGIAAILTSDKQRTRDTAAPLAARLGLRPGSVPYTGDARTDLAAIARWIAAQPPGALLVVTHSDRVPCVVLALTAERVPALAHLEYDRLYRAEAGRLAAERYGAPFAGASSARVGCDLEIDAARRDF